MVIAVAAFFALLGGFWLGRISCRKSFATLTAAKIRSVTRFLAVTTQIAALGWVSCSYLMAIYATVRLAQPMPVAELSGQAITALLGVNALKVLGNIFEHNDSKLLGTSVRGSGNTDL